MKDLAGGDHPRPAIIRLQNTVLHRVSRPAFGLRLAPPTSGVWGARW
jgi:hypothetical protein